MLATMSPPSSSANIFSFSHEFSYKPTHASPLSSSPIRASQSSPSAPLSPRDPNTLPRRHVNSSPLQQAPPTKFKYCARDVKKNPLRQSRENGQESRRKLFLKNVRQRADDKQWGRRGGDQEVLKLEWATLDQRRRQLKDSDIDGLVLEDELEDIPEMSGQGPDDMMVDSYVQEEEAELDAMLSAYEAQSQSYSQPPTRPDSPSLSDDDDYDSLFVDLLSKQESPRDIVLSGQMDMS
ncbi:hypothetical protein BJ170DRAFT_183828 [Xylariales sp. AK1849]|nr:hypothetical protein BJ170DRAFT_183828 [Xylariales sp. AK1849]